MKLCELFKDPLSYEYKCLNCGRRLDWETYDRVSSQKMFVGYSCYGLKDLDLFSWPIVDTSKAAEPVKPTCIRCSKELSATLDAYYGRDEWEARKCSGCRK